MKRKLGLLLFIVFITMPFIVKAQTPDITISGPDTVSVNEKIDFTISTKVEKESNNFEATIKYDTSILELTSILKKDNWLGSNTVSNSGNNTIKFSNSGVTGETNIVTLRFRVKSFEKSTTTISVEDVKITLSPTSDQEEGTVISANSSKKDISIKSDDNTLKNIKVESKTISGFNSTVFDYMLEVEASLESVKIDATLNDSKSASFVEGFGPRIVSLEYGKNEVQIKTKSESGKEAVYKITIIRKDDRVSNNDLKSIILNGGSIALDFHKSSLQYTIHTYKLEKIEVDAVADDINSKVEVKAPEKLIIGRNTVQIIVTSVTGEAKTYTLSIENSEVPADLRIKYLYIDNAKIGFNSDTYKYKIRYDKSYKNGLLLTYTTYMPERLKAEVIGNSNLKAGSVVKIVLKATDGSNNVEEYTITLEKDNRINFFLILDIVIGLVVTVLIIIQLKKRKKIKELEEKKEEELEKTKELKL